MMLKAEHISKRYLRKRGQANWFEAVKPCSLELEAGTVTVLIGRSGSGKTTLLQMLSGLLTPSEGTVLLDGEDLYAMDDERLSRLRNQRLGVVPQGQSAIGHLTVLENVMLPLRLYGKAEQTEAALDWLNRLGIGDLAETRPTDLSGGELRRMAIARVLAQDTDAIMADEPTGDLDEENTQLVLSALQTSAREHGKTVLIVTHDPSALPFADRVLRMDGGSLTETA